MPDGMLQDADTFALWRMDVGPYPDYTTAADSVGSLDFDDGHSAIAAGPIEDIAGAHPWARLTSEAVDVTEAFRTSTTGGSNATIDAHEYAVALWVNHGNVARRTCVLFQYTAGGNVAIGCRIFTDGRIQINWDSGGFQTATSSPGVITSGTWHHVLVNVEDVGGGQQEATLYVDGASVAVLTANYPSTGAARFWVLGWAGNVSTSGSPVEAYEGRYCDMQVLDRRYTAQEISDESSNTGGDYEHADYGASVKHHWKFSEPPALIDETGRHHLSPPRIDAGRPVTDVASPIRDADPPTRTAVHFNATQQDRFRSFFDADKNAQDMRTMFLAGDYTIEAYARQDDDAARSICGWARNTGGDIQANNTLARLSTAAASDNWVSGWEHSAGTDATATTASSNVDRDSLAFDYAAVVVRNEGGTWEIDFYDSGGFVETVVGLTPPDGGDAPRTGFAVGALFSDAVSASGEWLGNIAEVRISDKRRTPAELADSRARLWGIGGGGAVVRTNPELVRSAP